LRSQLVLEGYQVPEWIGGARTARVLVIIGCRAGGIGEACHHGEVPIVSGNDQKLSVSGNLARFAPQANFVRTIDERIATADRLAIVRKCTCGACQQQPYSPDAS
jgi:hypothetical protein